MEHLIRTNSELYKLYGGQDIDTLSKPVYQSDGLGQQMSDDKSSVKAVPEDA